jgi:hypothetical protein
MLGLVVLVFAQASVMQKEEDIHEKKLSGAEISNRELVGGRCDGERER